MEFSIRMMVSAIIILIIMVVIILLVTGWGGSSNDIVNGLFEFFNDLLSGKTIPSGGIQPNI